MADFSVTPFNLLVASRDKGYVGLHIEQGVPVLDRDLNLMHDLVAATVREIAARYIGDGTPAHADGFGIVALAHPDDAQNFLISGGPAGPGRFLISGIEVTIPAAGRKYGDQPGAPPLSTPASTGPDPRIDTVYLDVFLAEVDSTMDKDLGNALDVGIQTSVRLKPEWVARVAEGSPVPPAPRGHAYYELATIARRRGNPAISASMITDLRQRGLTVTDLERRLRNLEQLRVLPAFAGPTPFQPPVGAPTTPVHITGRNFDLGPVAVSFDDVPSPQVTVTSPTSLTATVPSGVRPTTVPITITTSGGVVKSTALFTALGPPPVITGFTPAKGKPETSTGAATAVTITGAHFNENVDEETTVSFGDDQATITTLTNTMIVTSVPLTNSGPHPITVTTQWGSRTADGNFTVFQGVPS